jgi:hypothetical protein
MPKEIRPGHIVSKREVIDPRNQPGVTGAAARAAEVAELPFHNSPT